MSRLSDNLPEADRLVEFITNLAGECGDQIAVAFSGGVDSAVVAKATFEAVAERAIAVTAVSPSVRAEDRNDAISVAAAIGVRHVELPTREFDKPDYRANAPDRCFHCKDTLYATIEANRSSLRIGMILNGANADDAGDYRPGMQAASEHKVRSPLLELGFDKTTVRALAAFWNLSVADKPASPCLSSRVAYGTEVTPERVARIEAAEGMLRELLERSGHDASRISLRVRCEANDVARIELPLDLLSVATDAATLPDLTSRFRALGFSRITLDLEGFRSGSLNDQLVQLGHPPDG